MTIDQLRHFLLIHRLGSVNKASSQAHISQQALNVSMHKLEEEIGCSLFVRNSRGVTLSENGLLFVKACEEITRKIDETLQLMSRNTLSTTNLPESLHLYFTPAVGLTFIQNIMKIFTERYPNIQMSTIEKNSTEILQMLQENSLQAVAVIGTIDTPPSSNENYKVRPLFQDKIYIAVSKTHPLAHRKSVSVSTILKYPLCIYENTYENEPPLFSYLSKIGTPQYHSVTNNIHLYQNYIVDQNAIGFINHSSLKNHSALPEIIDDVIILPVKNLPPLNYSIIVPINYINAHEEIIKNFIEIFCSLN